jgi:hypothetical protein
MAPPPVASLYPDVRIVARTQLRSLGGDRLAFLCFVFIQMLVLINVPAGLDLERRCGKLEEELSAMRSDLAKLSHGLSNETKLAAQTHIQRAI